MGIKRTELKKARVENPCYEEEMQTTSDINSSEGKKWRAGTLTYSTGALVMLFFWLLWGDFSFQLKERAAPPTLQRLLEIFHAKNVVVGLLITAVPQVLSILIAPVVCYKSDRHRGRWGRRIPFLLVPTPLAVVAMVGLAYSPVIGRAMVHAIGSQNTDAAIVTSLGVFWGLFEVSSIICAQILNGLINDVVPHEMLGQFFGLFRIFSLAAGMLFHSFLMGQVAEHYTPIFLGFAILYGVSFTLMCFMVKEGEHPEAASQQLANEEAEIAVEEAPAVGQMVATGATPIAGPLAAPAVAIGSMAKVDHFFAAIREYWQECFSNSYYVGFFVSFALAMMAFTPINQFSLYFAHSVGMSDAGYGKYSTIQLFCSLCQAYPIGWLCDKIHPFRVTIISLGLYAIATAVAFFFVRTASMFAVAHVVCGTISGFWITATSPLGPAILPKKRFTQFCSAMNILTAIGMMVVGPACGWFIDHQPRVNGHADYHYIYAWASALMVCSLVASLVVYRRFVELGGPARYKAPE